MNLRSLAKRLPYPVKQGFKYAYGLLPPRLQYGKVFWETYNFLQDSQWWSRAQLEEYQMQQLSRLLEHAYNNVPYYRKIFEERGLKPSNIQNLYDFKSFPQLDKNTFKANAEQLVDQTLDRKKLSKNHTSGTTGKALQFYENIFTGEKELAFIYHQWSRVGYLPGSPRVEMRGAIDRNNPIHFDPALRVLRLSPLIDSKEILTSYIKHISRFGAKFLHGYPGAIASFANSIKRFGLNLPFKFQAVLFASEAVYEWEREITQEVFGCRAFSHYGMTEKVVLAAECEKSKNYHCIPQYGITEFDPNTNEIIGTGFLNFASPFIRYRTTDIASPPISLGCSKCDRNYFPVFPNVEGRIEDFIITPDGSLISPASITHPFKDLVTIKDTQIVQDSLENVLLFVVPWENVDKTTLEAEVKTLCNDLSQLFGERVRVQCEIISEIERSASGKFKWIRSELTKNITEDGIS